MLSNPCTLRFYDFSVDSCSFSTLSCALETDSFPVSLFVSSFCEREWCHTILVSHFGRRLSVRMQSVRLTFWPSNRVAVLPANMATHDSTPLGLDKSDSGVEPSLTTIPYIIQNTGRSAIDLFERFTVARLKVCVLRSTTWTLVDELTFLLEYEHYAMLKNI